MGMSVTSLPFDELLRTGHGVRAPYLKQQAGYTLGIAGGEGAALTGFLPHGYLAAAQHQLDAMVAAMGDKANMEHESIGATSLQDSKLRETKVWRRKMAKRASRAVKLGYPLPDELTHIGRAAGVPAVLLAVSNTISAAKRHIDALNHAGQHTQSLINDGQRLHDELQAADAQQETTRLANLPESVKNFLVEKARLYTALKVINDAAHELHADDPAKAARFNLRILHRHGGTQPVAEPPATPPATPVATPRTT